MAAGVLQTALSSAQNFSNRPDLTQGIASGHRWVNLRRAPHSQTRRGGTAMATRSLAFGVRLRDKDTGRTVRVLQSQRDPRRYRIEDSGKGRQTRQREHGSLCAVLRDLATTWRQRLH